MGADMRVDTPQDKDIAEHYEQWSDAANLLVKTYKTVAASAFIVAIAASCATGWLGHQLRQLQATQAHQAQQINNCNWELLNTPAPQAAHRCKQILNNSK
jgi:hypothetical protein